EQPEVMLDEIDHRGDPAFAEKRKPFGLWLIGVFVSEFGSERGRYRDQIITRIQAFGDLTNVLPQRLAIPQVQRAGEDVDLGASIVEVIFLGDAEARSLEYPRQRIADDRAAAVANVHRTGRV